MPHPNVQMVFKATGVDIGGVHTARFTAKLEGKGRVFGVKFRPGAFRAFLGRSVSTLRTVDLGYFDQAHFIRDFRRLVGCAPAVYARRARAGNLQYRTAPLS